MLRLKCGTQDPGVSTPGDHRERPIEWDIAGCLCCMAFTAVIMYNGLETPSAFLVLRKTPTPCPEEPVSNTAFRMSDFVDYSLLVVL